MPDAPSCSLDQIEECVILGTGHPLDPVVDPGGSLVMAPSSLVIDLGPLQRRDESEMLGKALCWPP